MKMILILISLGVLLSIILSAWGLIERNSMKNVIDQHSKTIAQIQANLKALDSRLNQPGGAPSQPTLVKVSIDDDPIKGDINAPVTIIEFSDYQCPYCKRYNDQVLGKIEEEYISKGKVRYVFRDFPLPFHEKAVPAAVAANCAGEQGKYWEFHNFLFEDPKKNLEMATILDYAGDLGLDKTKFQACVNDGSQKSEVEKDFKDGQKYGARGTPSFFIGNTEEGKEFNGAIIRGAQPYNVFKEHIEVQLKEVD
jgi:protein-disulfide isomerase